MNFMAKLYGSVAVKFRAFGIDFGYAKRAVDPLMPVMIGLPFPLPDVMHIAFDKYGIKLDVYIAPV